MTHLLAHLTRLLDRPAARQRLRARLYATFEADLRSRIVAAAREARRRYG